MKRVMVFLLVAALLGMTLPASALELTVSLNTQDEAAFQFLMDRANAKLAAQKKVPFASLSKYVSSLLTSYVANETKGVVAEQKAAVLRKIQEAPATVTDADKLLLGIK